MRKRALITGISGQDGSYLAAHLLSLGYEILGIERRTASNNHFRLQYLGWIWSWPAFKNHGSLGHGGSICGRPYIKGVEPYALGVDLLNLG